MAVTARNRETIEACRQHATKAGRWDWGAFETAGAASVPVRAGSKWRLKMLDWAISKHLPTVWHDAIRVKARAARVGVPVWQGDKAAGDVLADWLTRYAGADGADLSEQSIRDRAEKIATRARAARFIPDRDGFGWCAWGRLCEFVAKYGGVITVTRKAYTLESWAARAACPKWWRRQLRRWVAQNYERGAIELGRIGAAAGEWYCSNRAVKRRLYQVQSNEAAMRAASIESASGQVMSIWDAAQKSVSNKAIRRGELMTRIRGCEVYADSRGLAGVFTTNTCPSRFHSQRKGGGINPKYDGSTPGDAQKWLSRQWARLRAELARCGLPIMGFRVAEPHHDGCPHWHMLLWCDALHVPALTALMRVQWVTGDGDDNEPGSAQHRCNVKPMISGMAAGYIAKYISKNIDDAYISGHSDRDEVPGMTVGPDLLGDLEVKPCHRVEAWAALWRIRQFQSIGQPPVTVWRELRRVSEQAAAGGSDGMVRAWLAVHRNGEKKADWAAYMQAQGGAMLARKDYRFCVHTLDRDRPGRYERVREKWASGVYDSRAGSPYDATRVGFPVTPNKRERWGGEGFAAARSAAPWTRFNNCTRHNSKRLARTVNEVADMRLAGVLDLEGGGFSFKASLEPISDDDYALLDQEQGREISKNPW